MAIKFFPETGESGNCRLISSAHGSVKELRICSGDAKPYGCFFGIKGYLNPLKKYWMTDLLTIAEPHQYSVADVKVVSVRFEL